MITLRVSLDPKTSTITEAQFADFFAGAAEHTLTCIRYEAPGMDRYEWEHEERDAAGQVVARYTTWFAADDSGASAGFEKRGPDGATLAQESMPMEKFCSALFKSP